MMHWEFRVRIPTLQFRDRNDLGTLLLQPPKGSGVGFNGEKRSSVHDTGTEMTGSIPVRRDRLKH